MVGKGGIGPLVVGIVLALYRIMPRLGVSGKVGYGGWYSVC